MINNDNNHECGVDRIKKQVYVIANWLSGTLAAVGDDDDAEFLQATRSWLYRKRGAYDSLSIGYITCTACGHTWQSLTYTAMVASLPCPECGHAQSVEARPEDVDGIAGFLRDILLRIQS